ncbi:MAG TPA: tripartite tricarboxylate transporter substrate binding protein [Ramlibacter sp.]|uniref:tripartite tricarboxylate transporter substrate binding protein n=1 Tax=Ramlibacter sp. TaxID=1917967 RepID=UPI002CB0C57D|nr:tripartite tricarboxylate transporter substrate binding protein [Ramlibacter sp.]HVZ42641.1 tripartite tricarboxylate transporter substrate binding protein [Ramlibacter sp.]
MSQTIDRMRRGFVVAGLVLACAAPAVRAADAPYPSRPIRMVIPFAPGGPTDVFGRLFAQKLAELLREPVVPDNRAGAGSAIGVNDVAKAEPDGYTILFGTGSIATGAALTKLPFDPRKDIVPVAHLGNVPLVLLGAPDVAKTAGELLAALRAQPGRLSYGSAGIGTTTHLAGEMLKLKAKVDAVHVPYRGSGPALQDTAAGRTAFLFETITASKPLYTAGKLRLLAVGTASRSPLLPDVPTLGEAGVPGMSAYTWNILFVPKGTPNAIVERLNKASNEVLADPAFARRMADLATEVVSTSTPASTRDFYLNQLDVWADTVKAAGVKAE